jgi:hypothetical protein
MAMHPAANEAIRLLDEFVCRAVLHPCVLVSRSTGPVASRGQSEDTRISEETLSGSGTPEGNANMASASSAVAAQWGAYG